VIGDVWGDPVAWAKKCEGEFGADLICLQLAGTDPNGANRSVADAVATVKAVADAISVPLIVYGSRERQKDAEVPRRVAEAAPGRERRHRPGGRGELQVDRGGGVGSARRCRGDPIDVNMANS
jgi:CO dehydrogenase/acetyl-CoA synthase delta subunit